MNRYLVKFTRFNSNISNTEELVWVVVETKYTDCDYSIEKFENDAWRALWKQYPLWNCPFNSSNPAKTKFDNLRYSWSSPFIKESKKV